MTLPIEIQTLLYFLIPIILIILGIYLLFIHRRRCFSCGRFVRPFWRECPCASEPPTVFYQEPEEQGDFLSQANMKAFFDNEPPDKVPQSAPSPGARPHVPSSSQDMTSKEKRENGSARKVTPFSFDDAQPLSGEEFGTEVMLPSISPAWLLIEEWGVPEKRYEIRRNVISMGTSDDNDIILKDKAVSRHHAKIRAEKGKYFIYDLASTNGTRVNERKVSKKWIKEGDRIEVGHTRMIFKEEALPSEVADYRHKPSDLLKI